MKNLDSKFLKDGENNIIDLFYVLLEKSDYNLNQIVDGDSLVISDEIAEKIIDSIKEFLNLAPKILHDSSVKDNFFENIRNIDTYDKNDKFIKWLEKFIEAAEKPYKDAMFLTTLEKDTLIEISEYCFNNLILQDIGEESIDTSKYKISELMILRKIIFTLTDMVIVRNYSKENAFSNINTLFGIDEDNFVIWWELIKQHEEKLWRIMLMKRYTHIEVKLDQILEFLKPE